MRYLILVAVFFVSSVNANEYFWSSNFTISYYNTYAMIKLNDVEETSFVNADNCPHGSAADNHISIYWGDANENELAGAMQQVTKASVNALTKKQTRFHTGGCTPGPWGLAKVYMVQ